MDKKIAITLGGGGAKGFSHIGILKEFDKAGINFDIVTGCSIGALVGAAYCAGKLDALEAEAKAISIKDIPMLLSPTWSAQGFFSGRNALEKLSEHLQVKSIEDLPKKYAAVASNLDTFETVVFSSGDLIKAIRASISIPGLFTPVIHNNEILVDGGTVEPLPIKAARELGADLVVAINLFAPKVSHDHSLMISQKNVHGGSDHSETQGALGYISKVSNKLNLPNFLLEKLPSENKNNSINIIEILDRTLAINQHQLTKFRLAQHPADLLIHPSVESVGVLDFHHAEKIIEIGQKHGKEAVDQINTLIAS